MRARSNKTWGILLIGGALLIASAPAAATGPGQPPAGRQVAAAADRDPVNTRAARAALERLVGRRHAEQVTLAPKDPGGGKDSFRVSARHGRLVVEGTSTPALLTGFDWYLKYVARADISLGGEQLDLPHRLPLPPRPIERTSSVRHRFAFNDTNEGYTNPYQTWADWERQIDLLALRGINEALVYVGQEAVYHQTMRKFGYTAAEMSAWIPNPAHQPWWLLQNLCCYGGPVSEQLIAQRVQLGRRIADRMRELGITPVFPGYYGTVPTDFAAKNPGAHTVPQGDWGGFPRPDWLDPTTEFFGRVAAEFYRVQERLFGATTAYKMDLLHEGGTAGDVPLGPAARAVQHALASAHPDAIWVILGWFDNPGPELLSAVDKSRMLIVDGNSEFDEVVERDDDFAGTPYAFGTIWNFGGHRNLGASLTRWNEKFFRWLHNAGTSMSGIALMPEAIDNNPAAIEFFTELPWHAGPVDLDRWFADYATARYGAADRHAIAAWQRILRTAYSWPGDWGSKYATGLYELPPSLGWEGTQLSYQIADFDAVLSDLLKVGRRLRTTDTYRYDVVDVSRQVLANNSQVLLPKIRAAYQAKDRGRFAALRARWIGRMNLLDELLGTNEHFLLGTRLRDATVRAGSPAEARRLEYDARSLMTIWGRPAFADYAARELSGLMGDYYVRRWNTFFDTLEQAMATGGDPAPVDWYAFGESWAHETTTYPTRPTGDPVRLATMVRDTLAADIDQAGQLEVVADPGAVSAGGSVSLTATLKNTNGFAAAQDVGISATVPDGLQLEATTPTSFRRLEPGGTATVRWTVTLRDGATIERPIARLAVTARYRYGATGQRSEAGTAVLVPTTRPAPVYLSDLPFLKAVNGWGPVERDLHNGETAAGDGGPLVLDGVTYPKGLGTNSNADVEFYLGGNCTSFHAVIGIDDTMTVPGKDPDVVVKVYADDRLVHDSGLIDETTAPATVDLDLGRAQKLRLVVEQFDQDFYFDRLDFADAKVTCGGS